MSTLQALTAKQSRSAQVRAQSDYPVIDTDIHTNGFSPLLEDYIAQYGGEKAVDTFREPLRANGLNAFSGHSDVPELTEPLAEAYDLVREGAITEEDFKALVFDHPYSFYTANNPDFFKGTQVEQKLQKNWAA